MARRNIKTEKTKDGKFTYRVFLTDDNKKTVKYSEARHGKYAKPLADLVNKTLYPYKNFYEISEDKNFVTLYLYIKSKNEYVNAYLDIDDFNNWGKDIYLYPYIDNHTYYLAGDLSKNEKSLKAHQFIMGKAPKGYKIDHINGNGLDNRKSNLRIITDSENSKNVHKPRGSVPIVGIGFYKKSEKDIGFRATWYEKDKGKKVAYFALYKFSSNKECLLEACKTRNKKIKENNYPCQPIDIDSLDLDAILEDLGLKDE